MDLCVPANHSPSCAILPPRRRVSSLGPQERGHGDLETVVSNWVESQGLGSQQPSHGIQHPGRFWVPVCRVRAQKIPLWLHKVRPPVYMSAREFWVGRKKAFVDRMWAR